jgi:hypothetical protein
VEEGSGEMTMEVSELRRVGRREGDCAGVELQQLGAGVGVGGGGSPP